jgi:hypothetical protein
MGFNPLNAELNPICHLLALLGARPIFHVSRIRVNSAFKGLKTNTKKVKPILSPPHTKLMLQYKMVPVSALLHNTDTRVTMTNVTPGGSLRKVPSWELPPAATNWKEHSLFLGMRDIRIRELNPELLAVRRGQVTVTVATFYSLHCHQSRLFVTLENECLERKFTFSDKPSSMNDTICTLFRWEPDRKSDGSSCVGIPL